MTTKHTPTPWKVTRPHGNYNKGKFQIRPLAPNCADIPDANRMICAIDKSCAENEANAAFIVRACNAHEPMVEILKKLVKQLGDEGFIVVSQAEKILKEMGEI